MRFVPFSVSAALSGILPVDFFQQDPFLELDFPEAQKALWSAWNLNK